MSEPANMIRALLPDGSLPQESQAFVSQQVAQEAGQYVTDAQAAQAAAEAARDAAAATNVQIGGRNLLRNSAMPAFPGTSSAGPMPPSLTAEGIQVVSPGGGFWRLVDVIPASLSLTPGEPVTFSVEVKSADATGLPTLYFGGGMGYYDMRGTIGPGWTRIYREQPWSASSWDPHMGFTGAVGTYIFRNFKLEKGNHATDWTPAPEDIGVNPDTAQWAAPHSLALELADAADAAALTIVGTGRPDIAGTLAPDVATRVAAAPSGSTFYSTDGPQGAWEWRKKGASWVCTEGDTGWLHRPITLPWGAITGGQLKMRRAGTEVQVELAVNEWQAGSFGLQQPDISNPPNGFRQTAQGHRPRLNLTSSSSPADYVESIFYLGRFLFFIRRQGFSELPTSGVWYGLSEPWHTTDPWPTTLTL